MIQKQYILITLIFFFSVSSCYVKTKNKNTPKGIDPLANYFSTKLENRPDTFFKYSIINFIINIDPKKPNDNFYFPSIGLPNYIGLMFKADIYTFTNINIPFETFRSHDWCWYTISDTTAFVKYIKSCKSVLANKEKMELKKIYKIKQKTNELDFTDYTRMYPKNRIKFLRNNIKKLTNYEIYLIVLDLDIIYNTNIMAAIENRKKFITKSKLDDAIKIWSSL